LDNKTDNIQLSIKRQTGLIQSYGVAELQRYNDEWLQRY